MEEADTVKSTLMFLLWRKQQKEDHLCVFCRSVALMNHIDCVVTTNEVHRKQIPSDRSIQLNLKNIYKTTKRPQLILLRQTLVFQINCWDISYLHISLMVSLSHVKQCIILLKSCHTFQRLLLRFRDKVYYVMSVVWFGACVIWSRGLWLEPGGGNRHHQRNTMLMMKNLNFWPGFLRPFHKALNSIKYQSKKF